MERDITLSWLHPHMRCVSEASSPQGRTVPFPHGASALLPIQLQLPNADVCVAKNLACWSFLPDSGASRTPTPHCRVFASCASPRNDCCRGLDTQYVLICMSAHAAADAALLHFQRLFDLRGLSYLCVAIVALTILHALGNIGLRTRKSVFKSGRNDLL